MKRDLTRYADGSCWISGDRVNACIGADGITEFGFHGLQPVSRNSRMLVRPAGALTILLRDESGIETPFEFSTVDWEPHRVGVTAPCGTGSASVEVIASGRAVHVFVSGDIQAAQLIVRFQRDACFSNVRGGRRWQPLKVEGSQLMLCCRDRIELGPWIRNTGPYAGDFLIPEHWRRMIFNRPIRSGLATPEDLRPEYRDSRVALNDARTWIVMRGGGGTIEVNDGVVSFVIPVGQLQRNGPAFTLGGSEIDPSGREPEGFAPPAIEQVRIEAAAIADRTPMLNCGSLPELSAFMSTVPALVRSATVHDAGMTRATPGAYYWLWAWDNLVTGQEALRWGADDLAGSIVRYVNSHRDLDGRIPGRWTRAHEPMDTPPHGALEFLLLHLAYEHALATGDVRDLLSAYPNAVAHLKRVLDAADDGFIQGLSFYPDRPSAFGRTDHSVVALEIGCLYSFVRLLDNAATWIGDPAVSDKSRQLGLRIEQEFTTKFWDETAGFLLDSFDFMTGERNESYPLFSLLFLQSALGLPLVRRHLPAMGRYLEERLLTELGTRLLPARDERRSGEDALGSWYPHWDIYLLKVLRRAGRANAIRGWATNAERVLERLGYVPEFISLNGLTVAPGPAWLQHGAVSNLNCVTGWYRAVVEALCGIELDPGGISVIPLRLGTGSLALRGLDVRGTRWDVSVEHGGKHLEEIRVDGEPLTGCLKVPARFQDCGSHELLIRYGATPCAPAILEALNAEILDVNRNGTHGEFRIRSLGMTDIMIGAGNTMHCLVDGAPMKINTDAVTGVGTLRIPEAGIHELKLAGHHQS
jgi:hypothetical protein